jgi:hypothetical protein
MLAYVVVLINAAATFNGSDSCTSLKIRIALLYSTLPSSPFFLDSEGKKHNVSVE